MVDILLVGIPLTDQSPAWHIGITAGQHAPMLHLLTRSNFDDKILPVCIPPTKDLHDMVDLIAMTVECYGKPGKQLLIMHELPEAYWQFLRIELLRRIPDVDVRPLPFEYVDVLPSA